MIHRDRFMADKQIVKRLVEQVERLLDEHRRISGDCRALVAERDALAARNRALQEQNRQLESKIKCFELGRGMGGEKGDRERARARVNNLLREVDKCIAMLDRPDGV
jgi:uncharacterized protein (DUF3084 family)